MYETRIIDIKNSHPGAGYFDGITHKTKNMYNVANFYIRNTMTGILKSPEERTANETEVLHYVFTGLQEANRKAKIRYQKLVDAAKKLSGMKRETAMKKALAVVYFNYPDENHRFLSYEQMDAVFKNTKNPDYYSLPSQANQQAIRRVLKAWKAYFNSLKARKENPGAFAGHPIHIPGYIREKKTTAYFTNQICKPRVVGGQLMLTFPDDKLEVKCGKNLLPEDVVKVEVKPRFSGYRILVTFQGSRKMPGKPKNPSRILGLDPGTKNFMVGVYNFPHAPFIAQGGWIKAKNRWFNKERARLVSELTSGGNGYRDTAKIESLSLNRERCFRDYFYKLAHYICRACQAEHVEIIVCGHNKGQKDEIHLGTVTNQNFVPIPFMTFYQILTTVAAKYGIYVLIREESYTSKADFLAGDPIPTWKGKGETTQDQEDPNQTDVSNSKKEQYQFSGKRVKRGQYRSKDGTLLNADVNAGANIIRKEYPDAFAGIQDFSFLWKTVDVVTREMLVCKAHKEKEKTGKSVRRRPKRSAPRRQKHDAKWRKKISYMEVFNAGQVPKTVYIKAALEKKRLTGKAA